MTSISPLYYHRDEQYYECLGCGEALELPPGVAKAPEAHFEWLETEERMHAHCGYGLVPPLSWPRGDDGRHEPTPKAPRLAPPGEAGPAPLGQPGGAPAVGGVRLPDGHPHAGVGGAQAHSGADIYRIDGLAASAGREVSDCAGPGVRRLRHLRRDRVPALQRLRPAIVRG